MHPYLLVGLIFVAGGLTVHLFWFIYFSAYRKERDATLRRVMAFFVGNSAQAHAYVKEKCAKKVWEGHLTQD